jgi:nucleotide-binding universal stress UspA family protein
VSAQHHSTVVEPASVFDRVLAGVDGSRAGYEATRQAARLVAPGGWLEVFTAVHLAEASRTGVSAPRVAEELQRAAEEANRRGLEVAGAGATAKLVDGPAFRSIVRELEQERVGLVVVGTHGHRRIAEIMLGGVTGELLHAAPCSVLVARTPPDRAAFPAAIVAGNDGSECAHLAVGVAEHLARRFNSTLRVVTADEHPVSELVEASREADVLVVGSRGLRGLKALGSVSERVAHQAACSVLVVRTRAG